MIYLAAETPVSLTPWDPSRPAFHVRATDDVERARLRRVTSKPHLYYVGTAEKCGCPFSYGVNIGIDDSPAELQARETAIRALQTVLQEALLASDEVELLALDADDWALPRRRRQLAVKGFAQPSFAFDPPEAITVMGAA